MLNMTQIKQSADFSNEETASNELNILAGKVDLLMAQMRQVLLGNLVVSSLAGSIFWQVHGLPLTITWVLVVWGISALRYTIYRRHNWFAPTQPRQATARSRWLMLHSLLSGIAWGMGGLLFINTVDANYSAVVILLLAGMTAGALPSLSARPAVYWSYAIPALLPLSLYLQFNDLLNIPLGGTLILIFLLVNIGYSRVLGRNYHETVRRRFENLELIKELKEQKQLADQANIAKSRFLASASHDLRQPLAALGLFHDALEDELHTATQRHYMSRAKASADALASLFNALLDISKLEAGTISPKPRAINLAEVLEAVVQEQQPLANSKQLQLDLVTSTATVETDPVLLTRMLRNLLTNAILYTPSGRILIGCRRHANGIDIQIHDTGIGIAENEIENIFIEFHQLNNPERDRSKGLGLGLTIVQRLSKLLEHPLTVKSQPGKGSMFAISVPHSKVDVSSPLASTPDSHTKPWQGTVLVIDDEKDIRDGMQHLLERWGMKNRTADSLQQAEQILRQEDFLPQLLLCDYRLRDHVTGIQVIKALRTQLGADLPAILISGDTAGERLRDAREADLPLVHKPIDAQLLRTVINEVMAKHPD